jgi:hypothetical protein
MQKLGSVVFMLVVGAFIVTAAQATPAAPVPTQNYSPIEKVGCSGAGRCPWGRTWVCGPRGCGCAPCGGGYGGGYGWRRPCAVWVGGVCIR